MSALMFSRFARYFDIVARTGSVRRAAEQLHVASSAISRQIAIAEEELGVPLFERLPDGMRLTAAGELMIHGIRKWQQDQSRLLTQVNELRGGRRGEVHIGIPHDAMGSIIPNALISFMNRHPGIDFQINNASSHEIWQLVAQNEIDIGLGFNPERIAPLRVVKEICSRLGVIVPPDHAFATRTFVKFEDCKDYPLIMPSPRLSIRRGLDRILSELLVELRPILQASNPGFIKAIVAQNVGIGLLTGIDVLAEVRSGQLVFVPLADRQVPVSYLSLVVSASRQLSVAATLAAQHLSETLDTAAAELAGWPSNEPTSPRSR